jgi:hypothetical protein
LSLQAFEGDGGRDDLNESILDMTDEMDISLILTGRRHHEERKEDSY